MKNVQVVTFDAFSCVADPLFECKKVPNWNVCRSPVYITINTTNITTTTTPTADATTTTNSILIYLRANSRVQWPITI
jgi:hypothetical protein